MSSRTLGPKTGAASAGALRWPLGRTTSVPLDHDGAGAAVVADRQVLPVRRQRLAVGAEDPADVGGVLLAGVEVDVVGHLERQVHRDRRTAAAGAARPRRGGRGRVSTSASHARAAAQACGPRDRKSFRLGLGPAVPDSMPACSAATAGVQHLVADADADPAQVRVGGGEHAVRQGGEAERVVRGQVEPARCSCVLLDQAQRRQVVHGVGDPAAAERRKEGADDAGVGVRSCGEDVQQWRRVPLLQQGLQLGHLRGVGERQARWRRGR